MLKKRKNKNYLLVIFIFIISLIIFLLTLYLNFSLVLEEREIDTKLSIDNSKVGIDVNEKVLTFGKIAPNTNAQRNIILENNYGFPVDFEFSVKGDIERFLIFEKLIHLDINETKFVSISTITASREDYGDYSGKIIIVIKKSL